jgi:hypothetical protein
MAIRAKATDFYRSVAFALAIMALYTNEIGAKILKPIHTNWTNEDGTHAGGISTGVGFTISWQRGALNTAERNGAFLMEVLDACRHQLMYFQQSKFACEENLLALQHIDEAMFSLQSRRDRRQDQGTLGTHETDRDQTKSANASETSACTDRA